LRGEREIQICYNIEYESQLSLNLQLHQLSFQTKYK